MDLLSKKVLILNADYRAMTVCTVYKAFLLVYLDKAEIVNRVENGVIRTVSQNFAIPSVIKLRSYVNTPFKGVMLTRQNIFKRDGGKCVYCSSRQDLTLDHVVPRSRGGDSTWTNLVTACRSCNTKKGDYLPEEISLALPYKPFKPSFIMFLREFSGVSDESWRQYLQASKH
jgi:5-methylcytosine-specific restriction endonuclease McrA